MLTLMAVSDLLAPFSTRGDALEALDSGRLEAIGTLPLRLELSRSAARLRLGRDQTPTDPAIEVLEAKMVYPVRPTWVMQVPLEIGRVEKM